MSEPVPSSVPDAATGQVSMADAPAPIPVPVAPAMAAAPTDSNSSAEALEALQAPTETIQHLPAQSSTSHDDSNDLPMPDATATDTPMPDVSGEHERALPPADWPTSIEASTPIATTTSNLGPNAHPSTVLPASSFPSPATEPAPAYAPTRAPTPMRNSGPANGDTGRATSVHPDPAASHGGFFMPSETIPHGAPVRQYINTKITGTLMEGLKLVAKEQPKDPLRVLGEYLLQRSRELERSI